MERVTFRDERVQAKLEEIEPVSLDIDQDGNAALRQRYAGQGVPSFAMVDPRGVAVHRWVGGSGPEDFLAELELGLARHRDATHRQRDAALDRLLTACGDAEPMAIAACLRELESDEGNVGRTQAVLLQRALLACCERARERADVEQWLVAAKQLLARADDEHMERALVEFGLADFAKTGKVSAPLQRHIDAKIAVLGEPFPGSRLEQRVASLLGQRDGVRDAEVSAYVECINDTMAALTRLGTAAAPALRRALFTVPASSDRCGRLLAQMKLDETLVQLREKLAEDRVPIWLRASIVTCIGNHRRAEDLALLVRHAHAEQPLRVRTEAVWAMREVLQQIDGSADPNVAAVLGDALQSRDRGLLTATLQTMFEVRAPLPLDVLLDMLDDDRPSVFVTTTIADNALWILMLQLGRQVVDAEGAFVSRVTPEAVACCRDWLEQHRAQLRWSVERERYELPQ